MDGRFAGRIALVAGASRGLGRALALGLAREGATVVAVARTVSGLETLDDAVAAAGGPAPVLVPLDLTELDLLDRLGGQLHERFGRLDIAVLNAAVLNALSPVAMGEKPLWQKVFALNVFAHQRLLRSLDPLLRAGTGGGEVIGITCAAAAQADAYWGAYAASKRAFEAMALAYAAETAGRGTRCWLADPGPMQTALRAQAFPGEPDGSQPAPERAAEWLLDRIGSTASGSRQVR